MSHEDRRVVPKAPKGRISGNVVVHLHTLLYLHNTPDLPLRALEEPSSVMLLPGRPQRPLKMQTDYKACSRNWKVLARHIVSFILEVKPKRESNLSKVKNQPAALV